MLHKIKKILLVFPPIYILDQITKALIVKYFTFGASKVIIPGYFDLVHVRNRGAAFGFLAAWDSHLRDIFFYVLSGVAIAFLYSFLKQLKSSDKLSIVAVGMVFSGAIGNLTDRIFRGSVVDFLSFHWQNKTASFSLLGKHVFFDLTWPAFNVADMAISCGVVLLLYTMVRSKS
ncbi:signal peptidase II [bacterium]|nr:signal peptidase II [bacterium]